jgi:predicted nucleic acid-binding protein
VDTSTLRFDTGQIGPLRKLLEQVPSLRASMGDFVRFRLVVDANFVIQELIHRIRAPHHGASAFEELVKATVIDVFAPRWLETEMVSSAIPKAAKRRKVSEIELLARWLEFRALLKWDESLREPGTPSSGCDPKDLPYVLLQQKLNADGILSKDAHIARMGGHPLTLDFVFSTRNYARSAVTTVTIRVMGTVLGTVAIMALVDLLRSITRAFATLPNPIKALLLIGGAIALLHPASRRWLADRCADACTMIEPAARGVMECVTALAATSAAAESRASAHLVEATRAVRPKRNSIGVAPRARRRRSRARVPSATSTSPIRK